MSAHRATRNHHGLTLDRLGITVPVVRRRPVDVGLAVLHPAVPAR